MQANSLLPGEILLLEFELCGEIEQSELFLFFRNHFIEKRQVVAEEKNRRRIVDLCIFAHIVLKEDGGHRRDVLMTETQVGTCETGVAGLYEWHSNAARLIDHVPGKNLLGHSHSL